MTGGLGRLSGRGAAVLCWAVCEGWSRSPLRPWCGWASVLCWAVCDGWSRSPLRPWCGWASVLCWAVCDGWSRSPHRPRCGWASVLCCAVCDGWSRSPLRPAGGGGDPGRSAGRLSPRVLQHRRAGRPPVPERAGTQRAALPPVPVRHGQLGILAKLAAPAGETAAATNTPGCRLMQVMFK